MRPASSAFRLPSASASRAFAGAAARSRAVVSAACLALVAFAAGCTDGVSALTTGDDEEVGQPAATTPSSKTTTTADSAPGSNATTTTTTADGGTSNSDAGTPPGDAGTDAANDGGAGTGVTVTQDVLPMTLKEGLSAGVEGNDLVIRASSTNPVRSLTIKVPNRAGSSECKTLGTSIDWKTDKTNYSDNFLIGRDCVVNVTSLGQVGQPIVGTFTGNVAKFLGIGEGADKIALTLGTFSIVRAADGAAQK